MSKTKLFISVLFSVVLLAGCSEDQLGPLLIRVTDGAYVLSEGSFTSPGKLSFYSVTKDTFYQSISTQNLALSDGMIINGSQLIIAEQGPNFGGNGKLYKFDSTGAMLFSSPPFGSSPYSLALGGNKIYVTNGPGSNVSVLDINSLAVVKTIAVGAYPQEILSTNGKIYVCNTSVFSGTADSTVSVIDVASDTIITKLTLRKDPTSIAVILESNRNVVYIGCQGGGGIIYKIDAQTSAKLDSFTVTNGFDKDISALPGILYYISGNNNIEMLNTSTRAVTTVITNPAPGTAYFYGYSYDNVDGKHYVLDAKNFTNNGSLYLYNGAGTLEKTFTTGIGPRRVVFKTGTANGGSRKPY